MSEGYSQSEGDIVFSVGSLVVGAVGVAGTLLSLGTAGIPVGVVIGGLFLKVAWESLKE